MNESLNPTYIVICFNLSPQNIIFFISLLLAVLPFTSLFDELVHKFKLDELRIAIGNSIFIIAMVLNIFSFIFK